MPAIAGRGRNLNKVVVPAVVSRGLRRSGGAPGQRGHGACTDCFVAARRLEDLRVWQQARTMAGEIYEVLERPTFRNNWPLRDQLNRASLSIVANIAEGFAQQSDRAFARYLFLAEFVRKVFRPT